MTLNISKTPPLRHFLSRIGNSTYRFNTILVGLNCVARELGDGGAIAVTWTKPEGAARSKHVASQAQSFACASATVLAADLLDSYIREIAQEEWLNFDATVVGVATKAVTRPSSDGGAYSVAERAECLASYLGIEDPVGLALIELFSKWRNVVAHTGDRAARLEARFQKTLTNHAAEIAGSHSHFRIDLAIKNYQSRAVPVAKEVTSLMANAVRFVRKIDEAAIRRVASEPEDLVAAVENLLRRFFELQQDRSKSIIADMWQGDLERRAMALLKILNSLGVSASSKPVSGVLPADYVKHISSMSRRQFEDVYLS